MLRNKYAESAYACDSAAVTVWILRYLPFMDLFLVQNYSFVHNHLGNWAKLSPPALFIRVCKHMLRNKYAESAYACDSAAVTVWIWRYLPFMDLCLVQKHSFVHNLLGNWAKLSPPALFIGVCKHMLRNKYAESAYACDSAAVTVWILRYLFLWIYSGNLVLKRGNLSYLPVEI